MPTGALLSSEQLLTLGEEELADALNITAWRSLARQLLPDERESAALPAPAPPHAMAALLRASVKLFPEFDLGDFVDLLAMCVVGRFFPDVEWLCSAIYEDTGGWERLYKQVGRRAGAPIIGTWWGDDVITQHVGQGR